MAAMRRGHLQRGWCKGGIFHPRCRFCYLLHDSSKRITSYINNLHPQQHEPLYSVIEKIIGHVIPSWNMTLTGLKSSYHSSLRIVYKDVIYDPDPESWPETEYPQAEGESEDEFYDRRRQWIRDTRRIVQPEPGQFMVPFPRKPEHLVDLKRDTESRASRSL